MSSSASGGCRATERERKRKHAGRALQHGDGWLKVLVSKTATIKMNSTTTNRNGSLGMTLRNGARQKDPVISAVAMIDAHV